MLPLRNILLIATSLFLSVVGFTQHPNREKIAGLEALLSTVNGVQRVDCLNALSEEYWWPPKVIPDSISCWATPAYNEAVSLHYTAGIATATMHLGVANIFKKNFRSAETQLRQALGMFENMQSNVGLAWCHVWLGQTLYSENQFNEAISSYNTALPLLQKLGDWEGLGKAWAWLSLQHATIGNYDSSFYYCSKSLDIRKKMSDYVCVAGALANMGHLYHVAGAYEDALDYYRQGLTYAATHHINLRTAYWNYLDEPMSIMYQLMNEPDSSDYYLQQALEIDPTNQMTRITLGETLLTRQQYDAALKLFLEPVAQLRKGNDQWDLMRILLDVSKVYEGTGKPAMALPYARESFSIAHAAGVKQYMVESTGLLAKLYQQLHKIDSAYFFLDQYTTLKDAMVRSQFIFRLANYKKQTAYEKQQQQVAQLARENKIKEQELRQATALKWALITGLIIILASTMIVYRNILLKRKNERLEIQKKQSEFQYKTTELEMQALRAQMNPHFIFNCLSSINSFILKNQTAAASDYLTKFSRLIRMVLNNSNKTFIALDDELDMLKLYLDMEQLRFKNAFDYTILFQTPIDASSILVPPLLLQPFAENAIWHGLMHKQGHGDLEIALSISGEVLSCVITDNGVGRSNATHLEKSSVKHRKSMGLQITAERLALLNKDLKDQTFLTIDDITDAAGNAAGTRVTLKLHVREGMEVIA